MSDALANAVISAARDCLRQGFAKIEHCVSQLDDAQIWWPPAPRMNSIANLLLHLSGNLRQWVISGLGGLPDVRNRPAEFAARDNRPKYELLSILRMTVQQADAVLAMLTAEQLVASHHIQGFDLTGAEALWNTIPHFRGHVQEIIHMTRAILGDRYGFHFVPQGAEQQSAGGPPL